MTKEKTFSSLFPLLIAASTYLLVVAPLSVVGSAKLSIFFIIHINIGKKNSRPSIII